MLTVLEIFLIDDILKTFGFIYLVAFMLFLCCAVNGSAFNNFE